MDLKSILHDSQSQRGPPHVPTASHTSHSSYDGRIDQTSSSDVTSAKPTPYGPPLLTGETRAHGGGGYFAMQSPHPNTSASASTPSVGPPSAYAQSPGGYGGVYTPRDSIPPSNIAHNAAFVSPSPVLHHSSTPGSVHHAYPPPSPYAQNNIHPAYQHFSSPPAPLPNGLPHQSYPRQISPTNHFQSQPATPLGPPIIYPKASPQAQRPPSQGGLAEQHLRKGSVSSVSSVLSKDYNHYPQSVADSVHRRDSIHNNQRTGHSFDFHREKSASVSPKTIPKPPPQRQHSTSSRTMSQGRSSLPPQSDQPPNLSHHSSIDRQVEPPPMETVTPTPILSNVQSSSHDHHVSSSPSVTNGDRSTMNSDMHIKEEEAAAQTPQPSLKRSASHFSDTSAVKPPPAKRPRHNIPPWAHSARQGRRLKFVDAPVTDRTQRQGTPPRHAPPPQNEVKHTNGTQNHAAPPRPPVITNNTQKWRWEGTISNIVPNQSITRHICDWIVLTIGDKAVPVGASWEIEAKIGNIVDMNNRQRFRLFGADSEVLLNSDELKGQIRFESNMTMEQHKAIYEFLHSCGHENHQAKVRGEVKEDKQIHHTQLRELDEFYELTDEGKAVLDPQLRYWVDRSINARRKEVRVRQTVDLEKPSNPPRHIIKSRIADKEISCPDYGFDYRISISLETPWEGDRDHLREVKELSGRSKTRHSYRHREFQVDLTQVSHYDDPKKEYEVEIEIAAPYLAAQMQKIFLREPNNYEPMIQDFVSNIQLLCKNGTPRR
ncbi:hypothetical protein LTR05_006679 [Lithohypha guttulata]|uniref:mRNA-capping enzyme subunit beta n=2 Tax=Lithohypha guttulata TaxID=1690604 RepID=A0AAN7SVL4_9EURO|nr:hypothetical protein LTR05_006679 [Lithohypha guttulata]